MNGLDTIRECMTEFLKSQGIKAVTAWPTAGRVKAGTPVAAVSLRKCEGGPAGFQDYLGERFNRARNAWEQLYGRRMKLVFGLDIYAPKTGGASACRQAFDKLAEAVGNGGPAGLNVEEFSCGEVRFDEGLDLFCCPVEAVCQAYLYAVADEGGAFLDFEVRGVKQ